MKKKVLMVLVAILAIGQNAFAYDFSAVAPSGQTLYYNISGSTVTVTKPSSGCYSYPYAGYTAPTGSLTIPNSVTHNGTTYTVTMIGDCAFRNCSGLTAVIIPSNVTSIGDTVFDGCTGLTVVTIGSGVTTIGTSAFFGCSRSLTSIIVANGNSVYDSRNNCNALIESATNTLVLGCINTIIPNSVTSIGFGAFYGCNGLTSIIIPNSVTSIGNYAFYGCTGLTSLTIPNSVTSISEGTFKYCSGLISVTIPNSVTSIGSQAFSGCSSLASITIGSGVTSIGGAAFNNCSSLDTVYMMPSTPPSLGYDVFANNAPGRVFILAGCFYDNYYTTVSSNRWYNYRNYLRQPIIDINFSVSTSNSSYGTASVVLGPDNRIVRCDSSVVIQATANTGCHFNQWSNGVTANPYTLTLVGDSMVTAIFERNIYYLTANVNDTLMGAVSMPLGNSAFYLDTLMVVASPVAHHHVNWQGQGIVATSASKDTVWVCMDNNYSLTCNFAIDTHTVIVSTNDIARGMVQASGTEFVYGTPCTVSATAYTGYTFQRWSNGVTANPYTFAVMEDVELIAIFIAPGEETYTVTVSVNDDLMGSVSGAGNYPYGTQVTIEATANDGYHFAEWSNGNRENPTVITLEGDTALTAIFTDDVVPQICMITVQDGRNMVMWDKELEVQTYNIYREGITAGEYELAASVPYDSLSAWVDTASRPRTRSYRYRMTATDIFGIESEPSEIHKTMHLYINQGLGDECNLVWSEYEGAEYSTYVIYRGTDANNIQQIDVMPAGGNTTYTDENPPAGEVYYQVGILLNTPCNPTKSSTIVRSNIAIRESVGIPETADMDDNIRIYTENGRIHVSMDGQTVNEFHVYDVVGREVYHAKQENHTSILPEGVYLVKVGNHPARRIVVIR